MKDSPPLVPIALSQHNCAAAGFKDARQYLEWTRGHPGLVTRVGKLRVVSVADYLEHLRAPQAEQLDGVDALLASVGRKRGGKD